MVEDKKNNFEHYFEKLKQFHIRKEEDLNVYEFLYFRLLSISSTKFRLKQILSLIYNTLFLKKYVYNKNKQAALFLYSSSIGYRKDHFSYFTKLCSSSSLVSPFSQISKRTFNFYAFKYLWMILAWKSQLKRIGFLKHDASMLALFLYSNVAECKYLFKTVSKFKKLITYCDVLPVDYYLTYLANKKGIKTMTIQHGYYVNHSNQYVFSHSNVFIANTELSVKYAVSSGLKNVVYGGPISDCDFLVKDKLISNGVFSVILDCMSDKSQTRNDELINDNKKMLAYADELASLFNLRYSIRYHPADYNKDLDIVLKHVERVSKNVDESVDSLIFKSDFILVNASSSILNAINSLTPAFRFIGSYGDDFEGLPGLVFRDFSDLHNLYVSLSSLPFSFFMDIKSEVIGKAINLDNYKVFFES